MANSPSVGALIAANSAEQELDPLSTTLETAQVHGYEILIRGVFPQELISIATIPKAVSKVLVRDMPLFPHSRKSKGTASYKGFIVVLFQMYSTNQKPF